VAILLYRVDERLIHGQVTVGWGGHLHPDRYVVVDDLLAGAEWEREIFRLGVPSDASSDFVTVEEGRKALREWRASEERIILVTRDLDQMLRLLKGMGTGGVVVNLGGIYHGAGRREILPYLFLSGEDRAHIRTLLGEGIEVEARGLPGSSAVAGRHLLDD